MAPASASVSAWPCVPDMHEHVAEEAPDLRPVAGVVDQGALHEVGLVRLQDPLVQHDAVTHEHDDLQEGSCCQCLQYHNSAIETMLLLVVGLFFVSILQFLSIFYVKKIS